MCSSTNAAGILKIQSIHKKFQQSAMVLRSLIKIGIEYKCYDEKRVFLLSYSFLKGVQKSLGFFSERS